MEPNEKEIITSRLIDRPIRPLINEDFKQEIQILITVISNDKIQNYTSNLSLMIGSYHDYLLLI